MYCFNDIQIDKHSVHFDAALLVRVKATLVFSSVFLGILISFSNDRCFGQSAFNRYRSHTTLKSTQSPSPVHSVAFQPPASRPPALTADGGQISEEVSEDSRAAASQTPAPPKKTLRPAELLEMKFADLQDALDQEGGEGDEWVSKVARAIRQLSPDGLPSPEKAKGQLMSAMDSLEQFLQPNSNPNGQQWLRFLRWSELEELVAADVANPDELLQIELNMRQNYPGLEMPPFRAVRNALAKYSRSIRYGARPERATQVFAAQLSQLAEQLQTRASGGDLDRQREIGKVVTYLKEANQAPELAEEIRNVFNRANARVLVSSEFAQRAFSRPVSEPQQVKEMILGTDITGTSLVQGTVSPRLVANNRAATVRLQLDGVFSSNNVGLNRGVQIFSTGSAGISASETVQLTADGLVSLDDTTASSRLNTNVNGIGHNCRLVRRIAKKKVAQQSGLANTIAESRLQSKLRAQFHEQLSEQLFSANQNLRPPALPILDRLGLPRPSRKSWSSTQYVALLWRMTNKTQLGAPQSCPLPVPAYGATAQLHHSLISNLVDPVLGGREIRNQDLAAFARQFGAKELAALQQSAEEEDWSITMAPYHPFELNFEDNEIQFILRLIRITRGDQELRDAATVTANYRLETTSDTIQLRRVKDVEIEFARSSGSLRSVAIRSFLRDKFEAVFKEDLLPEPVSLSKVWPAGIPKFMLDQVIADEGWLQLTLR